VVRGTSIATERGGKRDADKIEIICRFLERSEEVRLRNPGQRKKDAGSHWGGDSEGRQLLRRSQGRFVRITKRTLEGLKGAHEKRQKVSRKS